MHEKLRFSACRKTESFLCKKEEKFKTQAKEKGLNATKGTGVHWLKGDVSWEKVRIGLLRKLLKYYLFDRSNMLYEYKVRHSQLNKRYKDIIAVLERHGFKQGNVIDERDDTIKLMFKEEKKVFGFYFNHKLLLSEPLDKNAIDEIKELGYDIQKH